MHQASAHPTGFRFATGFRVCIALWLGSAAATARGQEPLPPKVVVTNPVIKTLDIGRSYSGKVAAARPLEIRPAREGLLAEIAVKNGQTVRAGDVLFKLEQNDAQAIYAAETADIQLTETRIQNAKRLRDDKLIAHYEAKLAAAKERARTAERQLAKLTVRAPFDGVIDEVREKVGSRVTTYKILATMSSANLATVEFKVPEADYLKYKEYQDQTAFELAPPNAVAKNTDKYTINIAANNTDNAAAENTAKPLLGILAAIEADFNNDSGKIDFLACYPNPDGVLKPGQDVVVVMRMTFKDVILIPALASFVSVVDDAGVVQWRKVDHGYSTEELCVVSGSLQPNEKIIANNLQLRLCAGTKVDSDYRPAEEVSPSLKGPPPK